MNDFLKKSFQLLMGIDTVQVPNIVRKFGSTRSDLIRKEGVIGGRLFGPIPEGCTRRLFYNQDRDTWIWYEEWLDDENVPVGITTRYEIHPTGVLKDQDGSPAHYIEGRELHSFISATQQYYEHVSRKIYRRDPATGKLLNV